MKKLLTILFVLFSVVCFSQSIVPRATAGNTVSDARLQAQYNFFIPRYADTTAANVQKGIDSTGAIIFTYDVNNFWIRVGNPKHWQQGSGGGTVLPDGVYSGGQVAYSGSGYDYIVSAATYVLAGVIYNSPQDTITLDPADPTFDRRDVIGLTDAGVAGKVTGVPAANPQEPSVNPQVFIRRAVVDVIANTTQPPNIDQSIIYDQGVGEPGEWTPSSEGNTDFLDTQDPYHLTIDAITVAINPNQRIKFVNDDTINSGSRSSLVIFTKLLQPLVAGQNINVQLLYQGNPVSVLLPLNRYGLLPNVTTYYQMSAIPFTEFSNSNIIFDEVDLIPTGASPFPFFFNDYIQIQTGLAQIVQIPDQRFGTSTGDNFANANRSFNQNSFPFNFTNGKIGFNTATSPSHTITVGDETSGTPTIFLYAGDGTSAVLSTSSGATLTIQSGNAIRTVPNNAAGGITVDAGVGGSNESLYKSFYNTGNTEFGRIGIRRIDLTSSEFFLDAPTNPAIQNYITLYDSIQLKGLANTITPDSIVTITGNILTRTPFSTFQTSYFNSNVGSSFRWAIPNTNQIKTLNALNGILADSATSNTLSIQVDSATYATKAYVQSVAGGGGFTGVTSFSFSNANGFVGSVSNPTTTPQLSLTTGVTNTQIMYSNSGAITGSSNLVWDNTNSRFKIGGSPASSAYLNITPSVAGQASFNIGAGGTAPSSPTNGDVWATSTDLFVRLNGSTIQITNPAAAGVTSITGTANQVIASSATGAVTLSLPQSIGTTSSPTFTSLTLGGTAATTPLTFTTNTDATASAGRWYYNTTRLGFSLASTILRVPLTNDVAPTAGQGIFGNGATYTVGTYSALNNSVLVAPSASGVTFRTNSIVQTLSGTSVTMNINNGENAQWTLTASGSSLAITNPIAGRTYFVNVIQDGTGSRTITTYPSGTIWYSGTAPVLKTTPAANNLLAFYYNGSNYYGYDWGSGGASGFSNPMNAIGQMIYGGVGGTATLVSANTTTSPMVLVETGTGSAGAAPTFQPTFTGRTNSATLDFPNTGAQSSSELTITVTGAVVGDVVTVGTTVNNANSTFTARVSATNIVSVKFNNYGAAAINPASGTFKVIVWQ